jgi:hypothetical protein
MLLSSTLCCSLTSSLMRHLLLQPLHLSKRRRYTNTPRMDFKAEIPTSESDVAKPAIDEFVTPHQLCAKCKLVAESLPAYAEQVEILGLKVPTISYDYGELSDLIHSARQGCHLCSIFTDKLHLWWKDSNIINERKLREAKKDRVPRIATSQLYHQGETRRRCLQFAIDVDESHGPFRPHFAAVHRHLKNSPEAQSNRFCESTIEREAQWPEETKYRWCKSTGSLAAHELFAKQLDNCLANHESCAVGSAGNFKPTRLLDLSPSGNSGSMDVRLVPGDITNSGYATLSYCWGGINPCVLTLDNYDAFQECIPWTGLPKTMRDAIVICRRLSVRYLWIDALCILQGPDGDFQQEAGRMQSVYSGSIFTIAAADSSNPHGGCFKERFPLRFSDCLIYEDDKQIVYVKARTPCDSFGPRGACDPSKSHDYGRRPGECILDERVRIPMVRSVLRF